ncbi:flagellar export chaperone FlgN [Thiomicrospira microaerophila]|uniref:flagellar export chaperone FlgN n=1 Tax=Thiomicrospira microaerophila TaxID=406020 RepID=UPI00200C5DC6|nr:flagellar export chaperone FlgN [Thiomicrospira microaerophila]UQB42654.1 flagellar export chaperone FlgN [Thiomicrospira microaerophila]
MSVINRNELSLQLEQLMTDLETFKSLLEQESLLLNHNKIPQLNEILLQKQSIADQLDEKIAKLQDQFSISLIEYSQLPTSNLTSDQHQIINIIINLSNQCFQLNRKNGMIISGLSHLNNELLRQLAPDENNINLYGASGKTKASDTKKTLGTA